MRKRFNLAKQLGFGFSAIILLMAVSAVLSYLRQRDMNNTVAVLQEEYFPTATALAGMEASLHRSVAALRGYLILGSDKTAADHFATLRKDAWLELDRSKGQLTRFAKKWDNTRDLGNLQIITDNFEALRQVQQRVEDIAHTEQNIPALQILTTEAAPRAEKIVAALTAIIEAEALQEATAERKKLLKVMADLRGSFTFGLAELRAYLLTGDEAFRRPFDEQWARNEAAFKQAAGVVELFTQNQRIEWDSLTTLRGEFAPLPKKMFDARKSKDWNKANHLLATEAAPRGEKMLAAVAEIHTALDARLRKARTDVETATARTTWTLLAVTALGIILGAGIAGFTSRRISTAINAVVERARNIGAGDLRGQPIPQTSNDEIGELAQVFNEMQVSLQDQVRQTRSGVENLNSASAQILASAQEQASATKEQAATVQEVTSTMQELSKSGADIADKAKRVATAAEASSSATNAGITAVEKTTRIMDSIREQVEEVAGKIVALSEKTQAVGEITAAVNDVAEQSKLLALNAAIEAAAANQEGNRFSVVAGEMKNLADQAKESTAQVRTVLAEIQKGINTSVMLTEEAVKRVESGKQQADITQQTIRQLAQATDESVQAFQQIIGGTNQQQIGFDQVTQGMQDIRQATEQTAASTAQLEGAVANLNALSRQLTGLIEKYKV